MGSVITHLATMTHLRHAKATLVLVNSLSDKVLLYQYEERRTPFGISDRAALTPLREFSISNSRHRIQACFTPTLRAGWSGAHHVVTGSEDGSTLIFDADSQDIEPWINQLLGHDSPVVASVWSSDGRIL